VDRANGAGAYVHTFFTVSSQFGDIIAPVSTAVRMSSGIYGTEVLNT
jgi:hypothetical protein